MIYFIDFDGTICPNSGNPPQKECIEVLTKLKIRNNTILIYSCRSNPNCVEDYIRSTSEMETYLKQYNVPYDGIVPNKPYFNYIIDDRCVGIPLTKDYSVDWQKLKPILDME